MREQLKCVERRRLLSLNFLKRGDFMFKVAIDGPSGAGKSTIAKAVAKMLGFVYIDTGAMYRACALACLNCGVDIKADPEKAIEIVNNISIDIDYIDGTQRIFLNGEDVSLKIRTPEVSMGASNVSAIGDVRKKLVLLQRELAGTKNVIMDGRDIGTHVLPDADAKIFLTASPEVRANRRYKELLEKGIETDFETVLSDIKLRDHQDQTRASSPLRQATDAVLVDTSELSFDESVERVLSIINNKRNV